MPEVLSKIKETPYSKRVYQKIGADDLLGYGKLFKTNIEYLCSQYGGDALSALDIADGALDGRLAKLKGRIDTGDAGNFRVIKQGDNVLAAVDYKLTDSAIEVKDLIAQPGESYQALIQDVVTQLKSISDGRTIKINIVSLDGDTTKILERIGFETGDTIDEKIDIGNKNQVQKKEMILNQNI